MDYALTLFHSHTGALPGIRAALVAEQRRWVAFCPRQFTRFARPQDEESER